MCIAIYKPKDVVVNRANLEQCFKSNPDGAGFLIAKNKRLIIKKGYFTFDEFYGAFKKYENEQALIHFRIRTHGDLSKDNCHPFMINPSLGFIHNGVISGFGIENMSDTSHFNNSIFKPLVDKYGNQVIFEPAIQNLVEARIGYSKLAFLDRHGNYKLFNEDKGLWDNGVWYSNSSYKIVTPTYKTSSPVPFNYKQPISKPKHRNVEEGDLITLIAGHYDSDTKSYYKTGTIFEVVAVNKDYTVDAITTDVDKVGHYNFVYNVSYSKFDFLEIDTESNSIYESNNIYDEFGHYTIRDY